MNNLQATELLEIARRMQAGLTQLGLCHQLKQAGLTVGVSFRSLELVDQGDGGAADFGLLEIDMLSLPRRVTAARLTKTEVLHHLRAIVGKPVYMLNASGITYCVDLRPPSARRGSGQLPERVDLDLSDIPRGAYRVPIGVSASGPIWRSLPNLGHALLGGATQTGKSSWVQSALAALLTANGPDKLQLALVDPKAVEFSLWSGVPHLICPVATDVDQTHLVTGELVAEMSRRQYLFTQVYTRSLRSYNAHADSPLPIILAIFDELSDITLVLGAKSQAYRQLVQIVQKGAGLGIFAWLATQNPLAEVLGTLTRGQLTTRLAFRCNEGHQSKTILDRTGAERLPINVKGRMLARLPDAAHLVMCQGYYLEEDELLRVACSLATEEPVTWDNPQEDSDDDPLAERAREMHASGESKRQIALQLYGGDGGAAWRKMEAALESSTTTTEQG